MNIKKDILFVFLFTLLITVLANMDIMLVKNLSSSEMTGYYSVLSLLGRILLWVNMAIVSVVLPEVYANGRDGSFINRNILFKAYGLIFLTSCAVVLIYYFFPGIVISLLFGEQYLVFQNELWFFAILAFVLSLLQLEANFAYAQHNFNVCYMLLATFLTMIGAIYLSHATIRQMVLSIILSFGLGYLCILVVNLSNTKKQFLNRKTNL